jgi:hypothetical protein
VLRDPARLTCCRMKTRQEGTAAVMPVGSGYKWESSVRNRSRTHNVKVCVYRGEWQSIRSYAFRNDRPLDTAQGIWDVKIKPCLATGDPERECAGVTCMCHSPPVGWRRASGGHKRAKKRQRSCHKDRARNFSQIWVVYNNIYRHNCTHRR